jgi:ribosomal protein S27E
MAVNMAAAVGALRLLERKCPKCHHKQTVGPSRKHEAVPCEKCDEMIPPHQAHGKKH